MKRNVLLTLALVVSVTFGVGCATAGKGTAIGAGAGGAAGAGGSSGASGASGTSGAGGEAGSSAGTGGSGTAGSGTAGSGAAGSASGACKAPGKTLAGGCYFLLDDQTRARDAADAACGAALAGAKLAWFGSKADQDAVLAGLGAKATDYWIGLDCASHDASCNAKGAKWTWAGGAPIAFDAWGEVPNDGEGCARLSGTSGAYTWLDRPCATPFAAICRAP